MIRFKFNTARISRPRRQSKRGAIIVETAMVFLLIVSLTLCLIQFGMFYGTRNALTQVTRDGSRFAAVYCITANDNSTTPGDESTDQYIIDHILATASKTMISDLKASDITISPVRAARSQYGSVTVTLRYNLDKKSFLRIGNSIFRPGLKTQTSMAMIE